MASLKYSSHSDARFQSRPSENQRQSSVDVYEHGSGWQGLPTRSFHGDTYQIYPGQHYAGHLQLAHGHQYWQYSYPHSPYIFAPQACPHLGYGQPESGGYMSPGLGYPPPGYIACGPPPHYLPHECSPHVAVYSSSEHRSPYTGNLSYMQTSSTRSRSRTRSRDRCRRQRSEGTSALPLARADAAKNEKTSQTEEIKLELDDVIQNISEYATTQDGSRFLQSTLDNNDEESRGKVFVAVLPKAVVLANDAFGNFVVQKLFELGDLEQKRSLVEAFQGKVRELSSEKYGCRAIQKALQVLPPDLQLKLAEELKCCVIECIQHMHGNYVIQRCVERMPPNHVDFIVEAVDTRVEFMASHPFGCRVIQRLLERCPSSQLSTLLDNIPRCTDRLAHDPHGNYVVQHVLEYGRKEDKHKIIDIIQHNIVEFSKNKCSSNVVEKCFKAATSGVDSWYLEDDGAALMQAVFGRPADANSPLRQMVHDKFGNYIVQCIIRHSRLEDREHLRQQLWALEPELRESPQGLRVAEVMRSVLDRRQGSHFRR